MTSLAAIPAVAIDQNVRNRAVTGRERCPLVLSHRQINRSRNHKEHSSHAEDQRAVSSHERCCGRKSRHTRRHPSECCLKPRRRRAETCSEQSDRASERDHLNSCNGTARGFGGFAARAKLGEPPNTAGIRDHRTCAHFLASVIHRTSDGHYIGADRAPGNMRAQIGVHALGPARLERGCQCLMARVKSAVRSAVPL